MIANAISHPKQFLAHLVLIQHFDMLVREAPFFKICWLYMGIAQITPPPLCQMGKYGGKKYSKPSWQVLTPPGKRGKKVAQTILASLYTPAPPSPLRAMPIWKQHISKRVFP